MDFSGHKEQRSHGDGKINLNEFKKIGPNIIFEDGVLVFHSENISLGTNIYIGHRTILKGYYKNEMVIGDHTWIGQDCFFHSAGGLIIGKAVGIGPGVKILTSSHRDNDLNIPILFHDIEFKPVVIEDGCDLGTASLILPGVRIGQGAVIGAGSVVTNDIEPYTVVAGVPARIIRKRSE